MNERLEKLRRAQLKDVSDMQRIYAAAGEVGADVACMKLLNEVFALSKPVKEGIEAHAGYDRR